MSSIDRSPEAHARPDDLMIHGEFDYDAEDGSLAWSAVGDGGGGLLDLDDPPVRQALDLSVRRGTPFSFGRTVVDADGVAHELVVCGLTGSREGHPSAHGVVLELAAADGNAAEEPTADMPRLTSHLGRLPAGVTPDDLPWAGIDGLAPELRAMVNLCLESSAPTTLTWGKRRHIIYNQAFADTFPAFHPQLFGTPVPPTTAEGWADVGAAAEQVFVTGEPLVVTDQRIPVESEDEVRERYFTFSLTPIRQADGAVVGLYASGAETTQNVLRRRRLRSLHDLAATGVADGSIPELVTQIATILAGESSDIPFALLYLVESGSKVGVLQHAVGLAEPAGAAPETLALDGADGWPVAAAIRQSGTLMVDDVQVRFAGLRTVSGQTPSRAMLAYADDGHDRLPRSLNIFGVSTRQALDLEYQQFLHRVARQIQADLAAVATTQLDRERSANLQRAMQSNRQIGAAIGILMTIHKITEPQAFQLLSKASQQTNRKLRDIADDVILSGALPADAAPSVANRQGTGRRGRNERSTR